MLALKLFIFAASLAGIAFAATFPFDFGMTGTSGGQGFDWRWTQYDPFFIDRAQNVLLFVPLGFAAASLCGARRHCLLQILVGLLTGLIVSSGVEMLQIYVSFRDPSLADLWCNTLGGAVGAIIHVLAGEPVLSQCTRILHRLRPLLKAPILAGVLLIYAIVQLSIPLLIARPGGLARWSGEMPLAIGNEPTGDRPWRGRVHEITLSDNVGGTPMARYQLRGGGPYQDLSGNLGPLIWSTAPLRSISPNEVPPIDAEHWLRTAGPVATAIHRIIAGNQFTLAAIVQSDDSYQRGPAKIVTISNGPYDCNVQFAQEFTNLAVRVRTGAKNMPDLYLRDVFTDSMPHQIVVTLKDARIAIHVDGRLRGEVTITPEAALIWRLYPRDWFGIWVDKHKPEIYALIYRAFVLIPFSILLAAALKTSRWSVKARPIATIGAIVAMWAALELVLQSKSDHVAATIEERTVEFRPSEGD